MNAKKAKQLKKAVYGEDNSYRFRKYEVDAKGIVHADPLRKMYQYLKKVN